MDVDAPRSISPTGRHNLAVVMALASIAVKAAAYDTIPIVFEPASEIRFLQ
jgi:hypothetical protein